MQGKNIFNYLDEDNLHDGPDEMVTSSSLEYLIFLEEWLQRVK